LFMRVDLGNDAYYRLSRLVMPAFKSACEADAGIVLARSNDGHMIRYHTDCSVMANNFLLTKQHFDAVDRVDKLFDMTPEQLLASGAPVKYVFVRARGILISRADGTYDSLPDNEANMVTDRLSDGLLWAEVDKVPIGFQLIDEIKVPGRNYAFARVWKISQSPAPRQR
jgi:hypothetical protein